VWYYTAPKEKKHAVIQAITHSDLLEKIYPVICEEQGIKPNSNQTYVNALKEYGITKFGAVSAY
jgi:hypothetical protein